MKQMEIGKALTVREGEGLAILNFGALLAQALTAAEQLNATVVDMRWVKPIDEALVLELSRTHELLVTLEENAIAGGAGSGVNEFLATHGVQVTTLNLGLPDDFIEHGSHADQLSWSGLDSEGIVRQIRASMKMSGSPGLSSLNVHGSAERPH